MIAALRTRTMVGVDGARTANAAGLMYLNRSE